MKLIGKVVHGAGRGQGMGTPTVNLDVEPQGLQQGVYAVRVRMNGELYLGAMHYGPRPSFEEYEPRVEVHLLDFDGDLYGEQLEIELLQRLREVRRFESREALVAQIERDVAAVRAIGLA